MAGFAVLAAVVVLASTATTAAAAVAPNPPDAAWRGGDVTGRVLDAGSGRALEGASVHAAGTRIFATTGVDGSFRLPAVPPGTPDVVAAAEGRQFESVPLEQGWVEFRLAPEGPRTVPLPDYPRPDFDRRTATRGRWLSLNGSWSFDFDPAGIGERERWFAGKRAWGKVIRVPFGWQSLAAFGEGERGSDRVFAGPFADMKGDGWYKRSFTVPGHFPALGPVALKIGAVDWSADVWLDGRHLGFHENGYAPFEVDLGPLAAG